MEYRQSSELFKNSYVVIQNRPCQIQDLVPGQDDNGNDVITVVGKDIFTGEEYEVAFSPDEQVSIPTVTRLDYQISNVADEEVNLMSSDNVPKDVPVPRGELGGQIKSAFEGGADLHATVIAAMGEEAIVSYREATRGE